MKLQYLLPVCAACVSNATAAIAFTETEGVPSSGFGANGATTLNLTAVGHAQGFEYDVDNVGVTGTLTVTSSTGQDLSGGSWRGNPSPGAGYQSFDYRLSGAQVLPAGQSLTFTYNMSTLLNNGGGTANVAPLAFGGRFFSFASPPVGLTIDLESVAGTLDFNDLTQELTGTDFVTQTATSLSATSDADTSNDFRVNGRILTSGTPSGGVSAVSITLTNDTFQDITMPFFRVTLDGSAPAAPVPEPSSALLALGGLLALARRRR